MFGFNKAILPDFESDGFFEEAAPEDPALALVEKRRRQREEEAAEKAANPEPPHPYPAWKEFVESDYTGLEGLPGDIFRELERTAHRSLPAANIAGALSLVALACGRGHRLTPSKGKISLMAFVVAPTAAGKEHGQRYAKCAIQHLGWSTSFSSAPRSDKAMLLDLMDDKSERAALYMIDEAHAFLAAVESKRSSEFKQAIASLMLELATTNHLVLSGTLRREVQADLAKRRNEVTKELMRLEKQQDSEDGFAGKAKIITSLNATLAHIEKKEAMAENGIADPRCSFLFTSTPANMAPFLTIEAADAGLLGRSLLFIGSSEVAALRDGPGFDGSLFAMSPITNRLADIANATDQPVPVSPEGREALKGVRAWADYHRNHVDLGALYRRLYERVVVVASLLAAETGIGPSHVKQATAICLASTDALRQSLAADSGDPHKLAERVGERILTMAAPTWELVSRFRQRVRKEKALQALPDKMFNDMFDNQLMAAMYKGLELHGDRGAGQKVRLSNKAKH